MVLDLAKDTAPSTNQSDESVSEKRCNVKRWRTSCTIAWLRAWKRGFEVLPSCSRVVAISIGSGSKYLCDPEINKVKTDIVLISATPPEYMSVEASQAEKLRKHGSIVDTSEGTYRAIFLRPRNPFLAPPLGSSVFSVTRSILDMILIHGISKLTIADMADSTPLYPDRQVTDGPLSTKRVKGHMYR